MDNGTLEIGSNFYCNKNCFISCSEGIRIGSDNLWGWNVSIRDSDGHTIIHNGTEKASSAPVEIGDHVWIASYADILKGVHISNNSVIAYRSCVTKSVPCDNVLVAGCPAKIVQDDIDWHN